jgi:hypothetical protein
MNLTDSEREEFITLTANTYDPELFTEEDLPALRESKRQWEEEQARASAVLPADQPAMAREEDYGG